MSFQTNDGMDSLATVLTQRIENQAAGSLVLDFGTIEADYSLKTNTFPTTVPKTDYMVCRSACYGAAGAALTTVVDGKHGGHESSDGSHSHAVPVPDQMRTLQPGDRVLVAWIQNDAVVIDIVKPASEM